MNAKFGEGYTADVKRGNRQLGLKSEICETGPVVLVYDMIAGCIVERENVEDLEAGRARAEEVAKGYLFEPGFAMPQIAWKKNS